MIRSLTDIVSGIETQARVRFGVLDASTGDIEWKTPCQEVNVLLASDNQEKWVSFLSLQGRPLNGGPFLLPQCEADFRNALGVCKSQGLNVAQFYSAMEPMLLRMCILACLGNSDLVMTEALANEQLTYNDLSVAGKVIYKVMDSWMEGGGAMPEWEALLDVLEEGK